ncbi:hypothetical protein FQN49_003787 [Arthroderma sp. PD_2]|nr:hypothetical protein FQN49_003787 [Arthroderma sp. PD_2]
MSKCLELLPARESLALDRLFGLLSYHRKKRAISCHPSRARRGEVASATWTVAARTSRGHIQKQKSSPAVPATSVRQQRSLEGSPALSLIPVRDDGRQNVPVGSQSPKEISPSRSPSTTSCSGFHQSTTTTTPATSATLLATGETTPFRSATDDDSFGTIKFALGVKLLLEKCKTDRGGFMRAIRETKVAFPTGQGWEAAIATKEDNADMRDLMKIYHRFECYNIYQHVVEAGFHTGTHWIRDMRPELVKKLCQDFPGRFQDQKAANKSLNWVDQGCRYHEWAELFSGQTMDLGYLIALPLDIPHSAYTSRCTKERMHTAVLNLKSQGIDEVVRNLELSELSNHIVVTLREMTSGKRKDIAGETAQSPCMSPLVTPGSSIPVAPAALDGQPEQNPTPPELLAAGFGYVDSTVDNNTLELEHPVYHYRFGHSTSTNTSRSTADNGAVAYDELLNNTHLHIQDFSRAPDVLPP